MNIKAVTFDLDDTLWPLREVIIHAHKESNNWLIEKYPEMKNVLFTEQEQKMWQKLISKDGTLRHKLSELRIKVIETLLLENGIEENEASSSSKTAFDIFLNLRHDIKYFEGTLEVLESLKEKYVLGVLTNGNASIETLKIDHLFDFYLNAEMVGDSKPGAAMFQEALKITDLKPEEICHIGDHPENDVEAAITIGMRAIWLNLLNAEWPKDKNFEPIEVTSWYDLEEKISNL
jgi:putative hydrolase of the HAD superfamily